MYQYFISTNEISKKNITIDKWNQSHEEIFAHKIIG
jgi:hypothetical protein